MIRYRELLDVRFTHRVIQMEGLAIIDAGTHRDSQGADLCVESKTRQGGLVYFLAVGGGAATEDRASAAD